MACRLTCRGCCAGWVWFCPACRCDVGRPPRVIVWFQLRVGSWRWAVAVAFSMAWTGVDGGVCGDDRARRLLAGFRGELYRCLTRRADALFSLADAVLCASGRICDLARLSLVPEFGRGHGALYDGLNAGRAEFARLRRAVAGLPLPAWPDGRIRLAVDVSNWLRPEAATSPGRMFCHVHGRGKNAGQVIPGWPYSFVAALQPGAGSWTLLLDAVRLGPDDDEAEVTGAAARGRGTAGRGRALEGRRPAHHHRRGRRLQRDPAGLATGRPAGGAGRQGARRPGVLPAAAGGPPRARPRPAARCPDPVRRPGYLGRRAGQPGRGLAPVRAAGGHRVAAGAPEADSPVRRLGTLARRAADR